MALRDNMSPERLTMLVAVLATVLATIGVVTALMRGDIPIVGVLVAVFAGRIAFRLWVTRHDPEHVQPETPPHDDNDSGGSLD